MKYVVRLDEVEPVVPAGHAGTKNKILFENKKNRFAMWLGELDPGGYAEMHRHSFPQAFFVIEGDGEVEIGNQRHPLSAGTAYFAPAGVEHRAANLGPQPLKVLVFSFNLPGPKS